MPVPRKDESKDDFIGRCIPYVKKEGTAKDNSQAVAICNSIWKKNKEENKKMSNKKRILLHFDAKLKCSYKLSENSDGELGDDIGIDSCTMLVGDGIYNGVRFPSSEIEKAYHTFSGKPINLNHSDDRVEDIVGYIKDVEYKDNKLTCKPVFNEDTAKYKEAIGFIKSRFDAGDIPNVSIGVWLDREIEENEETGEQEFVARELEGDHLALVVHGACNPSDGCGIGIGLEQEKPILVAHGGETIIPLDNSNSMNTNYATETKPIEYSISTNDTYTAKHDDYIEKNEEYKDLEIKIIKEEIKKQKLRMEE